MTGSRAFNIWQQRLDTGRLTKSEIASAAKRIVLAARFRGAPRGLESSLTLEESQALYDRLHDKPVLLTEEHTAQGIDWFERRAERELGLDLATYEAIVSDFSHFSWNGDVEVEGTWPWVSEVPVWTIHLHDGRRFAYWYASGWRERRGNSGELWEVTE